MRARTVLTILAISLPLLPSATVLAQSGSANVTFQVPLNLTGLASHLTKVAVNCTITSYAFSPAGVRGGETEIAVSQGQVVTAAQVVVPITAAEITNPVKGANYTCKLRIFDASQQHWNDATHAGLDPNLQIRPRPDSIQGSFSW